MFDHLIGVRRTATERLFADDGLSAGNQLRRWRRESTQQSEMRGALRCRRCCARPRRKSALRCTAIGSLRVAFTALCRMRVTPAAHLPRAFHPWHPRRIPPCYDSTVQAFNGFRGRTAGPFATDVDGRPGTARFNPCGRICRNRTL
jgi:hypothetical protein